MKLMEALKITNAAPASSARQMTVCLVSGFTSLHLKTFLAAYLQRLAVERKVVVTTGLYGDLFGNLERATHSRPDAIAVALEWPDFDPRLGIRTAGGVAIHSNDIFDTISRRIHRLQEAIDQRLPDTTIALSMPTLPPRFSSYTLELDAILLKASADIATWAAKRNNVKLVRRERLDAISPYHARWDARSELSSGFPYHLAHASVLADLLACLIQPPAPKKGLITDLDDTLWSGLVGEAGVDGISWSLDRHSHLHALFQQQLCALAGKGALIGVASKNDLKIVRQAFERSDLLLKWDQVFPVEVSWAPKSEAVHRILQVWNVLPDTVVFVDDSPMELAEVKAVFPEVECLLFPKDDPVACIELLDTIHDLFAKPAATEEDTLRLNSLRVQPQAKKDFLEDAEAEITFSTLNDASDARPLELVNKTNQFNLNGRRYTESEWRAYLRDPQSHVLVASYKDKFGQLGKIAVLGARPADDSILIDTWVMSCRAFSRRIEHQCLRRLFGMFGVDEAAFDFLSTPRNTPLAEFFTSLLGSKPQGRFTLSRKTFEETCPQLFHAVKDNHHA